MGGGMPEGPRRLVWLVRDAALGVLTCSLLGSFGASYYLFDLCSHFRCQYLALLLILTAALWRMKSPRWAIVAFLGALHNAFVVGPYYLPVAGVGASQSRLPNTSPRDGLSLISFNVHTANRRSADVLEYLQQRDADVILLIEVDHRWIRDLAPLEKSHPHTVLSPEADNFGVAVYSKLPIVSREVASLGAGQSPSVWAELDWNGRRIGFLGTHPWPPMTAEMWRSRNEQLASVAARAKASLVPMIVAGDFNATPWCAAFQALTDAGLIDTALGFGVQPTWNAKIPLMRIPIDHVLATSDFAAVRRTVGPNCGSDHYAVEVELR